MKEYFSHDYNARNDLKIQALLDDHGAAGYGIFWAVTEILHEEKNHNLPFSKLTFKAIAKQMSTSVEQVETIIKSCLEYDLFVMNGGSEFYSERVDENIDKRDEISKLRSKAGKISAENRKKQTYVKQELTEVQQNSTKKRKEKEIKEDINGTFDLLIDGSWNNDLETYNGIIANYPKLFKMKRPLLFKEHERLVKKWGIALVKDIYRDMEAWSKLGTKDWAAGVADKWCESEKKKQEVKK